VSINTNIVTANQISKASSQVPSATFTSDDTDRPIQEQNPIANDLSPADKARLEASATSSRLHSVQNNPVLNEQQELLLGQLRLKIEEKQKEFDELKAGGKLSSEELLDFDRARARMMRPFELAQLELLRQYSEQFSSYITNLLDNVLVFDTKQLNMLLACTHVRTTEDFEGIFKYYEFYQHLNEIEKIDKLLPDFVNGEFKYLPDSPVVIRLSRQPESHLFEFGDEECKLREGGLTKEDIEKMEETFKLISQIELIKRKPDLFSSTESLIIVESCTAHGLAGHAHLPIIELDNDRTAKEIMNTIVHEDRHQTQHYCDPRYARILDFDSTNDDVKEVDSPWGLKKPKGILCEIEAYNSGDSAALDMLEQAGFDTDKDFRLLKGLIIHTSQKLSAIKILHENNEMMNGDGIDWFNEQIDECKKLDKRLSDFLREKIVPSLDSSENVHRCEAFQILDLASKKAVYSEDLREVCSQKIENEKVPYVLTVVLGNEDISGELREAALDRFNSKEFQDVLSLKIESCFSDEEHKQVGYMYLSDGYKFSQSEDRKSAFIETFRQKLLEEKNLEFLSKLETLDIHPDLKSLVEIRKRSI